MSFGTLIRGDMASSPRPGRYDKVVALPSNTGGRPTKTAEHTGPRSGRRRVSNGATSAERPDSEDLYAWLTGDWRDCLKIGNSQSGTRKSGRDGNGILMR